MRSAAATEFDEAITVRPSTAGRFRAELAAGWRVGRAANGGYLAALPSGLEHDAAPAPPVPPPSELAVASPDFPLPEYAHRFDYRFAPGAELFAGGEEARSGGWMRLREERSLVALFSDAWLPALFAICSQPMAVPTLDLTIRSGNRRLLGGGWMDLGRHRAADRSLSPACPRPTAAP